MTREQGKELVEKWLALSNKKRNLGGPFVGEAVAYIDCANDLLTILIDELSTESLVRFQKLLREETTK